MATETIQTSTDQLKTASKGAWESRRNHPGVEKCMELQEAVNTADSLATDCQNLARTLAADADAGRIQNMTAMGDTVMPIMDSLKQWFEATRQDLIVCEAHLCGTALPDKFKSAADTFEKAYAYFQEWPRTDSEYLAQVRREIAKGESVSVIQKKDCA